MRTFYFFIALTETYVFSIYYFIYLNYLAFLARDRLWISTTLSARHGKKCDFILKINILILFIFSIFR